MSERIPLNELQEWEFDRLNAVESLTGKVFDAVPEDEPMSWVLIGEAGGGNEAEKTRRTKVVQTAYHCYVKDTLKAQGWKACAELMADVVQAVTNTDLVTLSNGFQIAKRSARLESWEKLPPLTEAGSTVRHGIVRVSFMVIDTAT